MNCTSLHAEFWVLGGTVTAPRAVHCDARRTYDGLARVASNTEAAATLKIFLRVPPSSQESREGSTAREGLAHCVSRARARDEGAGESD